MNKEYKTLWLKALRSGDYEQGIGQLRNENEQFCCLGVLYDIACKKEPEKYNWSNKPIKMNDRTKYYQPILLNSYDEYEEPSGVCLPKNFSDDIQFNPGGDYGDSLDRSLWYLNDACRMSFDEIADVIEKEF